MNFKKRARNAKYRAKKYKVAGSFTGYAIEALYVKQEGKCNICKKVLFGIFEVDHIIPLSKNGANNWTNLQILCPKCNKVKGVKI